MSDPLQQDVGGSYLAYRAAAPGDAAWEAFKREMSGAKQSERGQAPAMAVPDHPVTDEITGSRVGRIAKDVGKGLFVEPPRAIYIGMRNAVQNTYNAADDLGKWLDEKVGIDPKSEAFGGMDALRAAIDKKTVADPSTTTGKLIQGVSQFVTGLALTRRGFAGAGLPAEVEGTGSYAYSALKGAVANFAAFDPHQQRLSNLIEKFPELSNPVTQYLASKPDDTEAEGRFKNALEGTGLGVLADGFMKGVRLLRGAADAKATEGAQEAPAAAPGVGPSAFRSLGDESPTAPLVSDKPFVPPMAGEAPTQAPRGKSELAQTLEEQHAQGVTAAETPESVAKAVKPEKPQVYINFARMNTPEDVQAVTQQIADRFSGKIASAQRGTQTFEQIKLNAQAENAWDILKGRRTGEPLNAEESVAARQLWASSADKLKELAQTAVAAPTDENLFAFRKMMATHYAIQSEVIGARTETARALASWRIPVGSNENRLQDITDRMLDLAGGKDNVRSMAQFVSDRMSANQPYELDRFAEKGAWVTTRDALIQAFRDGLLSAPTTQSRILASNVTTGLWRIGERSVAERISNVLGTPNGVVPGEAAAMWSGWIGGFKNSMAYAGKSFKSGQMGAGIGEEHAPYPSNISSEAFKLDSTSILGRISDFIGNALSIGRRGIVSQHDMALTAAYSAEKNALAVRQATSEVNDATLAGKNFNTRVADLLASTPPGMDQAAKDSAKYQAFLDEPGNDLIGKLTTWILDGRKQIPALNVIAPFVKIPSRIMSYTFERSPLAPLMSEFRSKIAAGGATRDLALAQLSMGSMIAMTAADMTLNGLMKGGGPPQKGLEQAQEREGMMRDSMKVGNRWLNINGVHPVGKLMLLAADVSEAFQGGQTELHDDVDTEKLAVGTTLAIARTLVDNSYFTGFTNLFATLHDARVGGAGERAILSTAGSAVPAFVSAAARAGDPYQREVYNLLDEFKSKIPGLSRTLPPRRNLWGDPIPSGHDPLTNFLSPVKIADEKHEPIDDEILKQGMNITMPERRQTFGSRGDTVPIDMAKYPQAYSRLLQLSGNELQHPAWQMGLKDLLNSVVSGAHPMSSVYNLKSDGPEGGKEVMVRDLVSQYRDLAKKQLLDEYPALSQEVSEKSEAKRALKLGVQ